MNAVQGVGWTPLLWALWSGSEKIADMLSKNGADVKSVINNELITLHTAAYNGIVIKLSTNHQPTLTKNPK